MAYVRPDHVARSIGIAAYLLLNDLDPWMDYDTVTNGANGRPRFTYVGQDMDLVYGPYGTFLVPGISVEYGDAVFDRTRGRMPIILSLALQISNTSIEVTQDDMNSIAEKVRRLVFEAKSAPLYEFTTDSDTIGDPVTTLLWTDQTLRGLPQPSERSMGEIEIGGWLRLEFRFTVHYNRSFAQPDI